jgi:methionyl aminopeptidase
MAELVAEVEKKVDKLSLQEEEKDKVVGNSQTELDDNDDEGDDDDDENDASNPSGDKKKKKKKKKKKSAKKKSGAEEGAGEVVIKTKELPPPSENSAPCSRIVGGRTDYFLKYGQTFPPTIPICDLFPQGNFPSGEIQPHGKTKYPDPSSFWARKSEEEKRYVVLYLFPIF